MANFSQFLAFEFFKLAKKIILLALILNISMIIDMAIHSTYYILALQFYIISSLLVIGTQCKPPFDDFDSAFY